MRTYPPSGPTARSGARRATPPRARLVALALAAALAPGTGLAEEEASNAEDLAKQLANPVASLISVPLQSNWDRELGPFQDGRRFTLNVQPVVPFSIGPDWNLITRVILPVVDQSDLFPGSGSQFGLGDTVASLFFSPKAPTGGGWIWGAGPVFLLPTGTDDLLTSDRWGLGPTGVALRQQGPWTFGALANHIWSVAGSNSRPDVNASFLQPFLTYTTRTAWSFVAQAEASYDWERDDASVPVGLFVGKLFTVGRQPLQLVGGPRYYVSHFENGPRGWGARLTLTLLFPR